MFDDAKINEAEVPMDESPERADKLPVEDLKTVPDKTKFIRRGK